MYRAVLCCDLLVVCWCCAVCCTVLLLSGTVRLVGIVRQMSEMRNAGMFDGVARGVAAAAQLSSEPREVS